jgi:copper(I)-binding protein
MAPRFSIALLLAATAALAAAPVFANDALRADQARVDLGEVKAGTEAVATFVLHNDGDRDVRILRAKPS